MSISLFRQHRRRELSLETAMKSIDMDLSAADSNDYIHADSSLQFKRERRKVWTTSYQGRPSPNTAAVPLVYCVKYLGCHFTSPSVEADLLCPLINFNNNSLNVLGHNRSEPLAVHLAKSYYLPTILYGCEIWSISVATHKSMSVSWNNVFRKIFNTCWRESPRPLQFYCGCLPIAFLLINASCYGKKWWLVTMFSWWLSLR